MKDIIPSTPDAPLRLTGDSPWWLILLALVVAWQGWMTLGLFGSENRLAHLTSNEPVLSGRHPLHEYHGTLGARSLRYCGSTLCYDPAFHAGYPKTPVFDAGCRPAELLLFLIGSNRQHTIYKVSLGVFWFIAPLLFWCAARASGHRHFDAVVATILGMVIWWSRPARACLEAGDVDLCIGSAFALLNASVLLRYHCHPGPTSLLAIALTTLLGWFIQPLLMTLLAPVFLIYYVSVGTRHRLTWHLALWGAIAFALGLNTYWLIDWVRYWWIRLPPGLEAGLAPSWSLKAIWTASVWGGAADRLFICALLVGTLIGSLIYNSTGRRAIARYFGLSTTLLLALTVLGLLSEPLSRLGAAQGLVPALIFSVIPASYVLALSMRRLASRSVALVLPIAILPLGIWGAAPVDSLDAIRWISPKPLLIGLGSARSDIVKILKENTTAQARILWEDRRGPRDTSRWTALLPMLTDRVFVGGLDPDADIEHIASGLCDQLLAGKAIDSWSDTELADYCDTYNIGWVVAWSERTRKRFENWSARGGPVSKVALPDTDGGANPGVLLTIKRPYSYARVGSIGWMSADSRRIVLGEVVPENGIVVLSLHHQTGLKVTPSRVVLDDPIQFDSDSIPFIRLKVDGFVSRITLTWEKR